LNKCGVNRSEGDVRGGDGAVLRIVDHALELGEDGCTAGGRDGGQENRGEEQVEGNRAHG
jgi:hypothetical protein